MARTRFHRKRTTKPAPKKIYYPIADYEKAIYSAQEEPIVLSKALMDTLFSQPKPADLIALYCFYYYTAKWQGTNQPKATDHYCLKGLQWGYEKFCRTQRHLIDLGLIQRIQNRNEKGQIIGWFIKVMFIWKKENSHFVPDDPIAFEMKFENELAYREFQEIKNKGLHLKIYTRDHYKCVYCGNIVTELKQFYDQGLSRSEIANFVKRNPNKVATIDHIIPMMAGGGSSPNNMVTSCLSCNARKGSHQNTENPEQVKPRTSKQDLNALSSNNINTKKINMSPAKNRTKQYVPLAQYLSKIIHTKKNIDHPVTQINAWAEDIRKLVEGNKVSYERIEKALQWYEKNIGGSYIPVIESGYSLKNKFSKLEDGMSRKDFSSPKKPNKLIREGETWFLRDNGNYYNRKGILYR